MRALVKLCFVSFSLSLLCLQYEPVNAEAESVKYWEYIIVGAGPAGLQMGYFLSRSGRNYMILERGSSAGSFFKQYPRHDKLISINKRYTGSSNKEFNLRHDWNSLLSDDDSLKFTLYSKELFPQRETYVEYLNDFQKKLELKVLYNADVHDIQRVVDEGYQGNEVFFTMKDLAGNIYKCKTLIVATGMWMPNLARMEGAEFTEGYEDVPTDPMDFEGQSVLILGRGNAAFEVADRIYGSTNFIHMIGRSRVRLSWSTHYVGDLRGVNNALLDTYQLKSLDAVLEADISDMKITKDSRTGKLIVGISNRTENDKDKHDNFALRKSYDRVVRCLGFHFNTSLFDSCSIQLSKGKGRKVKYPMIHHNYESLDASHLFFAGTVTHSLDFRKASGGFVHGFRYTVRTLHRLLEWRNHGRPWPSSTGHVLDLLTFTVKRINEASGLYQMFGVLCDVIILRGESYEYVEEFPTNLLPEMYKFSGLNVTGDIIVVTLDYGANFSSPGADTFRLNRATGSPVDAHNSNFLHPVLYYYKQLPTNAAMSGRKPWETLPRPDRLHHMVEDFLTSWDTPISHILPLRKFFEHVTGFDLRDFFVEDCVYISMTHMSVPLSCSRQVQQLGSGAGLWVDWRKGNSSVVIANVAGGLELGKGTDGVGFDIVDEVMEGGMLVRAEGKSEG